MTDPAHKPLSPPEAKALARDIVETGDVAFSRHARDEMAKDDLQSVDCLNLLRAGIYMPAEHINGEWRYQVETTRICVVVVFASETRLRVVTAWRFKR